MVSKNKKNKNKNKVTILRTIYDKQLLGRRKNNKKQQHESVTIEQLDDPKKTTRVDTCRRNEKGADGVWASEMATQFTNAGPMLGGGTLTRQA